MNEETLKKLFVKQISDIYDAEKQLVKALPKLAKAAESEELSEALNDHLEQTETHVSRLEELFENIGVPAKATPCKGMQGLLEEGVEALNEDGLLRDLAIIAGCQKVEHYEISAYGTARTLAEQLAMEDAVELLQQTQDEEEEADATLSSVAASLYESIEDEDAGEDEDQTGAVEIDEDETEEIETEEEPAPVGESRRGPVSAPTKRKGK